MNFERGKDPKESMSIGIIANSLHVKSMYLWGNIQPYPNDNPTDLNKYSPTEVDTVISSTDFYRLMLNIKRKGIDHPDIIQKMQEKIIRHYKVIFGDHEAKLLGMLVKLYWTFQDPPPHKRENKTDIDELIGKYVIIGNDTIIPIRRMKS